MGSNLNIIIISEVNKTIMQTSAAIEQLNLMAHCVMGEFVIFIIINNIMVIECF